MNRELYFNRDISSVNLQVLPDTNELNRLRRKLTTLMPTEKMQLYLHWKSCCDDFKKVKQSASELQKFSNRFSEIGFTKEIYLGVVASIVSSVFLAGFIYRSKQLQLAAYIPALPVFIFITGLIYLFDKTLVSLKKDRAVYELYRQHDPIKAPFLFFGIAVRFIYPSYHQMKEELKAGLANKERDYKHLIHKVHYFLHLQQGKIRSELASDQKNLKTFNLLRQFLEGQNFYYNGE